MVSYNHPPVAVSLQDSHVLDARKLCRHSLLSLGQDSSGEEKKGLSHQLAAMQLVVSLEFKEDLTW